MRATFTAANSKTLLSNLIKKFDRQYCKYKNLVDSIANADSLTYPSPKSTLGHYCF